MKKTIPTNIANTLFYIEEDAYHKLDKYLTSIREHFATHTDSSEIVKDIEARIAEQFIEQTGGAQGKDRIITEHHVNKLIGSMGKPEDFDGESSETEKSETSSSKNTRKLYRDKEHAILGGVASGLATYFNIDPIVVRIIFFVSVFFGGAGIIAYIFFWIAVPEAKTATQKLEMNGDPVTIDSLKNVVREKVGDFENKEEVKKKVHDFAHGMKSFFDQVFSRFFPVIGKIIGIAIKIVVVASFVGLMIGFGLLAVKLPEIAFVSEVVPAIFSLPIAYFILLALFLTAAVPLAFVSALGNLFLNKKAFSWDKTPWLLIAIWVTAVVICIVAGTTMAERNIFPSHHYYEYRSYLNAQ